MPGALTRNVVKRVRSSSERSDGSDKKVSFNKSVHVKKIPSYDSGLNTRQSITVLEAESDPFWFNVYRDYNDFSDDVFTDRTAPRNVTSASRRHDGHTTESFPSTGIDGSSTMYGHVNLHPSQQIGTPPKIKRNLVRNIVAQFNEEAKRREKLRREFDETDAEALSPNYTRPISPIFFESAPDTGPNNNVPFSYTSTLPPSFMNKSRSEYDLKTPDDEIIYAQVVVNGHTHNGMANKTTVHTKVPNKSFTKEDRSRSMNRNQSISMTNLPSKNYAKPQKNNYMNGGIADYEPQRTMTQKKFVNEHERQESTRQIRNRSVSPELLISRDEERKKEHNNLKYLNGNAGLGHSENRKQTNYSEEYSTSTLHREKRKDKSKREKSPSHKEHKEKRNTSAERREEKREKRLQGLSREKHSTPREPSPDYKFSKDKQEQNREIKLNHLENSSEFKKGFKESSSTQQDMKIRRNLIDEYEFGNMREPFPDYKDESASKLYSQESSKHREEHKIPNGFEETEHNSWSSKLMMHDSVPNGHVGQLSLMNGRHEEGSRNMSKFEKSEIVKEEKVVTKKHRVTSKKTSPMREESPNGRSRKEKSSAHKLNATAAIKNKHIVDEELQRSSNDLSQKRLNDSSFSYNTLPSNINRSKDSEKKFYYFGANGLDDSTITRTKNENKTKSNASRTKTTTPFCSTKLVKEANAIVNGYDETDTKQSRSKLSDSHFTTVSPTGSGNQDSGYSSRGAATPASRGKDTPQPGERFVNIEVDGRKEHLMHHSKTTRHREERAFSEDFDERMETSESDELPIHWGVNGSLESHASPPSNQWSSLEEDDEEDIVAAHVNTPQSLIREMGKKEISYENSQRTQDKAYSGQMWFERTNVESDYRKGMSTSAVAGDHATLRNDNHINNNWGNSATLSRLETNKNRINNDVTMRSATVDRRQRRSKSSTEANQTDGRDVRILLNGRDITDSPKDLAGHRSQSHHASSGSLKVGGGYPSETESQHSGKSKSSRKSSGSSPTSKRVNFKTRSKAKRSASSAANLSPVHREVLMRSGSPARPPSTTGSLNSSGSDASNRSVILHATTVADIPPPRSYRYRIYRDSSASPGRRSPKSKDDVQSSNKSVTRSFSLLSPWKPKKYKAKYEQRYDNERQSQHSLNGSAEKEGMRRENEVAHNSSSEKLDSLSPLPSESTANHTSKKTSKHVSRHNSMPKDTRFTGFFKKKNKEA